MNSSFYPGFKIHKNKRDMHFLEIPVLLLLQLSCLLHLFHFLCLFDVLHLVDLLRICIPL